MQNKVFFRNNLSFAKDPLVQSLKYDKSII